MRIPLTNEVYIFTSPITTGIKFYDRSPDITKSKFAGLLPKKTYYTDIYSVEAISWNMQINRPNRAVVVLDKSGSYTATTIIVPPAQMIRILQTIENSENKSYIKIDIKENKYSKDNLSNIEELEILKQELLSKIQNTNKKNNVNQPSNHIDSKIVRK